MTVGPPRKVLITGGHEVGGLVSYAEALSEGFAEIGIPAEIIPPTRVLSRWKDLRDPRVLKILSTTAVFAAPFARRTICMVHGLPYGDYYSWARVLGFIASYKLTNLSRDAQLIAVSDYVALHIQSIYNVTINGVIRNPVKSIFAEPHEPSPEPRCYITYVGRLTPFKNVHRLLPAIIDVVSATPGLRACIIGDGELRTALEEQAKDCRNIEFTGSIDSESVRGWLRRTKVFVSGNQTEPFGITYLEAMSQGCVVAMPACGGGLEIASNEIGRQVQLLPISLERKAVGAVLRKALTRTCTPPDLSAYTAKAVASAYLRAFARTEVTRWPDQREESPIKGAAK
jgi:glycosyltransferase involved in cell wall biosynthesis